MDMVRKVALLIRGVFVLLACHMVPVNAQGSWKLLLTNAGIATMHAAVTRFNAVVLLDRTNIGPSQIQLPNGRCRDNTQERMAKHDCTAHSVMYDIDTNTIRPLFIFTDTWCSSGAFLADGTLLQTGGDYEGRKKIRKLNPCLGNAGCDWTETAENLTEGRWYSTNQLLPDGRVIIIGGQKVFSYEFFPKVAGQLSTPLQFLRDTTSNQEDNLYPYVHLMPNGNLYIFANRDSIELNYKNNMVVRNYPTIPGEPRNYPSAGSSVLLPLDGPSGYETAEVLVCGGAQAGAFRNTKPQFPASQTCGRMVVSDANPAWAMFKMPTPRNMGDMIILPSGEILLINGAAKGSQGFGFASDAVLEPVTYNPTTSEFSIMNATAIPRVYHSTASLLPDGRILVAGSNSHPVYTFNGEFPTELRLEAFSPNYLDQGQDNMRPQITDVPEVVGHGEDFIVTFIAAAGVVGLEMNMLSAPFTTHSYAQGQRMLRLSLDTPLQVEADRYTVVVTAPPNGNVAPPSYYMLFPVVRGIPGKAEWVQLVPSRPGHQLPPKKQENGSPQKKHETIPKTPQRSSSQKLGAEIMLIVCMCLFGLF